MHLNCNASTSEVTIYQKAVPRIEPDVNQQIQQFIANVRNELQEGRKKRSSNSSDDAAMDVSDESYDNNTLPFYNSIVGKPGDLTLQHAELKLTEQEKYDQY